MKDSQVDINAQYDLIEPTKHSLAAAFTVSLNTEHTMQMHKEHEHVTNQ